MFPRVDASADALCLVREANISEADRLLISSLSLVPSPVLAMAILVAVCGGWLRAAWEWLFWGLVHRGGAHGLKMTIRALLAGIHERHQYIPVCETPGNEQ